MQAWRADLLPGVLGTARRIWAATDAAGPTRMMWAFDAAMMLAALAEVVVPEVLTRPAIELRDRDRAKIVGQFDAVLRVGLAYRAELPGA